MSSQGPVEGVRERKKRLMRERLSDTATRMFLEQGFEAVRVSEVAAACGVSEKTVFNYFPCKEALVLDRLEPAVEAIRAALTDPGTTPVAAVLRVLERETSGITATLATGHAETIGMIRRFGDLLRSTPSLRAYQSEMMDRCVAAVSGALAARVGLAVEDPEPQIAARALLGLWRVQADSLHRHLAGGCPPDRVHDAVMADLHRAARLLDRGIGPWD